MIVHLGEFLICEETGDMLLVKSYSFCQCIHHSIFQTLQVYRNDHFFQTYLFWQSGEIVALKKVPLRKLEDGIPNTALRYLQWSNNFLKILSASPHLSHLMGIFMLWQFEEPIDWFHIKWRPVYYSFVYVLIRPTSLVLKEHFFCIFCVLTRLVGLISIETIGYFFQLPFMRSVYGFFTCRICCLDLLSTAECVNNRWR